MRKEWKRKMEEKMASFIDDRLEILIPSLAQKIEAFMKKEPLPVKKIEGLRHEAKCTGCGV